MGFLHDWDEFSRKIPGVRGRPPKSEIDVLHAQIIWEAWSLLEGSEEAITRRHGLGRAKTTDGLGLRQDEIALLRQGRLTLSPSRREQLKVIQPHLAPIMKWPMALLLPAMIEKRRLEDLIAPFLREGEFFDYCLFPEDPLSDRRPSNDQLAYEDHERLYERGDPMGFFALVARYRSLGLERLTDEQLGAGRYMLMALPGMCRHPAVKPHADKLIHHTKRLLQLIPDNCVPLRIDEDILRHQISSPEYEPSRQNRIDSAKRGHPLPEPVAPYLHFRLVRCDARSAPLLPSLIPDTPCRTGRSS